MGRGLGVFPILIVIALVAAGCNATDGTSTAPSSPTPAPTQTTAPAPTPLPATPTTIPTPIVDRTATAEVRRADQRRDELAYADWNVEVLTDLQTSVLTASDLMIDASEDPTLMLSTTWKTSVVTQVGIWQRIYRKVLEEEPPDRFKQYHATLSDALAEFDAAAILVEQGIQNMDAGAISDATARMNAGRALLEDASGLIPEW